MPTPTPYIFPKDDSGQQYFFLADDPDHPGYVTFLPNPGAHLPAPVCTAGKCEMQLPPLPPNFYEPPLVLPLQLFGVIGIIMLSVKFYDWTRCRIDDFRRYAKNDRKADDDADGGGAS